MKPIKYKKERAVFLILTLMVALAVIAIWCTREFIVETADVRQAEADMQELRDELTLSTSLITGEDGLTYIDYNPYTPYFLGHDDFFCWMIMPDTPIDYPVAHAPADDEYFYLTHNFTGSPNRYGCPYSPSDQSEDDDILFIYAHNNANASMFGTFVQFNDEDYFNEHFSMSLDFADVHREYEIIAVMDIGLNDSSFSFWDVYNFNEDRTEEDFLNQVIGLSYIKRYFTIDNLLGSDQYVLMMTCEYRHSHGRRIVVARQISETPYDPVINEQIIQHEGR